MSDPKYIYAEADSYEWDLFELRSKPKPGYYRIADVRCDDVTIERIVAALNGENLDRAYMGMAMKED